LTYYGDRTVPRDFIKGTELEVRKNAVGLTGLLPRVLLGTPHLAYVVPLDCITPHLELKEHRLKI
jgi:hypothetical protein